ncbi:MAG: thiol-activated cytolysin family protein [Trueperaceae bacterium]
MQHSLKTLLALICTLAFLLAGCGGQTTDTPPDDEPEEPVVVITPGEDPDLGPVSPPEVQSVLNGVIGWDEFSAQQNIIKEDSSTQGTPEPILDDKQEPKKFSYPSDVNPEVDKTYTCNVTSYDLTRTPEKIVTLDPDSDVVYPGSLIQGGVYGGTSLGSMRPIAVREGERAPTVLSLNLTDGGNYAAIVKNPSLSTTRQALGSLVQEAKLNEADLQRKATYKLESSESLASSLLNLNLSINVAKKVGLDATREVDRSINENRIYIAYIETAYTANVDAPASVGDLFTDKFTQDRLNEYIARGEMGPGKPILYVSGVTYGRMMFIEMTSTARREELDTIIKLEINASKYNLDAGLTSRQEQILNQSNIRITTLGGNPNANNALIENATARKLSEGLKLYFSPEYLPKITEYVPVSYAVRDTVSRNYAGISETTNYDVTTCQPLVENPVADAWTITIRNITQKIGSGGEEGGEGHFGQILLQGNSIWRADDPATNRDLNDVRVTYPGSSLFNIEPLLDNCQRGGSSEGCEATIFVLREGAGTTGFAFDGSVRTRFRKLKAKDEPKRWNEGTYDTATFADFRINPTTTGEGEYFSIEKDGLRISYSLYKEPITETEYNNRPR